MTGGLGVLTLTVDEPSDFAAPSAFGPYEVLDEIGRGASGPVFRAHDSRHDRIVALKVFQTHGDAALAERLVEAFGALAAIDVSHPAVISVTEAGIEGDFVYVVMPHVSGETLEEALRHQAPAPLDQTLAVLQEIAAALDHAWDEEIGHGALHPRDVIIEAMTGEIRVTGLGSVQALSEAGLDPPIRRPYSAPELAEAGDWDQRADVFSLGAIAHELLTGRRPVGPGEQDGALAADLEPEQRAAVRRVLAAALSPDPELRFASPKAFVDGLELAASGTMTATDTSAETVVMERVVPGAMSQFAREDDDADPTDVGVDEGPFADDDDSDLGDADISAGSDVAAQADIGERLLFSTTEPPPLSLDQSAGPATSGRWAMVIGFIALALVAGGGVLYLSGYGPFFGRDARPADLTAVEPPPDQGETEVAVSGADAPAAGSPTQSGEPAGVGTSGITSAPLPAAADPDPPAANPPVSSPPAQVSAPPVEAVTPPPPPAPRSTPARPAAPALPATQLLVRSTPTGALVTSAGRRLGRTPVTVEDLAYGTYTLVIARPGFVPLEERIELSAASPRRTVDVSLDRTLGSATAPRPAPAVAGLGSLFVDSRPRGATVVVDGRTAGVTPLRLPDLGVGNHRVRIEMAGYRTLATQVTVEASREARLAVSLEYGTAARRDR